MDRFTKKFKDEIEKLLASVTRKDVSCFVHNFYKWLEKDVPVVIKRPWMDREICKLKRLRKESDKIEHIIKNLYCLVRQLGE